MFSQKGFVTHALLLTVLLASVVVTAVAVVSGGYSNIGTSAVSEPCERLNPKAEILYDYIKLPGSTPFRFQVRVRNQDVGVCPGQIGYYIDTSWKQLWRQKPDGGYVAEDNKVELISEDGGNYFVLSQNEEKVLNLLLKPLVTLQEANYIYTVWVDPAPNWLYPSGVGLHFSMGNFVPSPSSTPLPPTPTPYVTPSPYPTRTPSPLPSVTPSPKPTGYPTPSPYPTTTPKPIPTTTPKDVPQITTQYLPIGVRGRSYVASVEAKDNGQGELVMSITGLPSGLAQGVCTVGNFPSTIKCQIIGTPNRGGRYAVNVHVKDREGNVTTKQLRLYVKGFWWYFW